MPSYIAQFLGTTQVAQYLFTATGTNSQYFLWPLVVSGPVSDLTLIECCSFARFCSAQEISQASSRVFTQPHDQNRHHFPAALWNIFEKLSSNFLVLISLPSSGEKTKRWKSCFYSFSWRKWLFYRDIMKWLVNHSTFPVWPLCKKLILGTL